MTIHLDHTIVPARNKVASAKRLAELLGVPWAESGLGPFAPVYVNDGLTLDFIETNEDFPVYHFCFASGSRSSIPFWAASKPLAFPIAAACTVPWICRPILQFGNIYWNEPRGISGRYSRSAMRGRSTRLAAGMRRLFRIAPLGAPTTDRA